MNAIAPLRVIALAVLVLPSVALAQPAPSGMPASTQASAEAAASTLDPSTAAEVDQRISGLKARLAITPAQEPAWDAFAKIMRDNTSDTDTLFAQRVGSAPTMTAAENMHSYAQIARAYADDTARLSNAFDTLYAGLTDQQRAAADTLFREQPADPQKPAPR